MTSASSGDPGLSVSEWDQFVLSHGGDTLTQSSHWARAKSDGFEPNRVVIREINTGGDSDTPQIVGGVQLLTKSTKLGVIAYAPKGPLLAPNLDSRQQLGALGDLCDAMDALRYRMIVVQPAELSEEGSRLLRKRGYSPAPIDVSTSATVEIDLDRTEDEILGAMRSSRRRNIRKALRGDATVRLAGREDLETFAALHASTAARQGFDPIPIETILHQWDNLHPLGLLEIFLVELSTSEEPDTGGNGANTPARQVIAGASVTVWGDRSVYKLPGWTSNPSADKARPNDLLHWEIIKWSKSIGLKTYDMGGFDREVALALQGDGQLDEEFRSSHSQFKLGFGGNVAVMPMASWKLSPRPLGLLQKPLDRLGQNSNRAHRVLNKFRVQLPPLKKCTRFRWRCRSQCSVQEQ